jgi:hypothetical protein
MHVNRGMLGWGVFLIALGAVPAAVRGGALDASVARRAWELWPLLLVGAGLGLALSRTRAAVVGGVVVALVFGLMGGGLVAGGLGTGSGLALCGFGSDAAGGAVQATDAPASTGTFGPAADVQLSADCGALTVETAAGRDWSVAWPASHGNPPVIDAAGDRLAVGAARRSVLGSGSAATSWAVTLPRDPALKLTMSVNAGTARGSLAGVHLDSLDLSVNAGDAHVDLTGAIGVRDVSASANVGSLAITFPEPNGVLSGTLSANAGSLRICVPAGVPLRIRTGDQPLGSNNLADRGLVKSGDTWTRGDVVTAPTRLDLRLEANLGSITLDPEHGCD